MDYGSYFNTEKKRTLKESPKTTKLQMLQARFD